MKMLLYQEQRVPITYESMPGTSAARSCAFTAEVPANYPSQQTRFILFLPEEETDKTTSTLLPQMLQRCTLLFASARAPTSVFDFPFSAIGIPPFFINIKG
jgi:hypothetical protein